MTSKNKTRDMTTGNIFFQLLQFSLPLIIGNVFQLLYNTVDTYVVGNFVGKEALAAVGSTTMIINMVVFFFNGLSIGAGVVISRYFGARNMKRLHDAVETTMAMTFGLCVIFTIIGMIFVKPMLLFMSTPEDVMPEATVYLRIYMAGISGLMLYNMASGILRAVGDTTRPLYILIFTSVMNVVLDLFFVLVLHLGVAGVSLATIISQFLSAIVVMVFITKTREIYRFIWRDIKVDGELLRQILAVGLPTAVQSMITAFSNVFVQSYVNVFGSSVIAGWSCYNKVNQFIMLPMDSMAKAATTFVRVNTFFLLANCVNHTLAGALRGRGDSKGPMIIMLACFVVEVSYYFYKRRKLVNV